MPTDDSLNHAFSRDDVDSILSTDDKTAIERLAQELKRPSLTVEARRECLNAVEQIAARYAVDARFVD